ncbi:phage tail assembly chaperone [Methylobacterium segetis]|uniref:phage tail assembly chaperone n=1 Tax=Methylobacterium segetis TaxID=2488750 RepID=UPI003CCB560F
MAEEDGVVPAALLARPDLPEHLSFAWDAFWALSTDRALGFGVVGPIPWSSLDRYAARTGITDPEEFERLARLVGAMDAVWRERMREEVKGEGGKS